MAIQKKFKKNRPKPYLFFCICKVEGNLEFLESQVNQPVNMNFLEALKQCKISNPLLFFSIFRYSDLMTIIDRVNTKLRVKSELFKGHSVFAICPSLKYSNREFMEKLNYTTIEKFDINTEDGIKTFYNFARYK